MSWPTVTGNAALSTTNIDAGTDSPATARADLKAAVDRINQLEGIINQMISYGTPIVAVAASQNITGTLNVTGNITSNADIKAFQ